MNEGRKDKAKMLMFKRDFLVILVLFLNSFCVNGKHFVLVHGGLHGAWCWYKVANQLKQSGHNVTTLDMAASGVNPKPIQEIHSVSEYDEPFMTFMASLPQKEKVILVGHSLGGLSVSIAMEKYPQKISVAVFITATVVSQNLTYTAFLQEDLTLAYSLVRPSTDLTSDVELLTKQTAVTEKNNGRVSKVYIISENDNLQIQDFQRWIIENTGPYAEVKVIKDSDHMVMFSKPKQLSSQLLKIAYKY